MENLLRRGVCGNYRFPLYLTGEETKCHLFLECEFTFSVWDIEFEELQCPLTCHKVGGMSLSSFQHYNGNLAQKLLLKRVWT